MNEPRPMPSQPGMPHAQGHPVSRPVSQPPRAPGVAPAQVGHSQAPQRVAPPPVPHRAGDDGPITLDDEPIALEEVSSAPVTPAPPRLPGLGSGGSGGTGAAAAPAAGLSTASKIKFAAGGDKHTYTKFKRQTHVTGNGPCRVRTFHGRLSDDGLAYTDDKINEWLDNHPEIEVKFVNCFTGPLEGKVTGEQGLIVVIWY
jgi:hypothetical protein